MTQQTAVSFLLRELRIEDLAKGEQLSVVLQICEQAKQMEKAQIVQSYNDGYKDGQTDPDRSKDISEFSNAKLYYNETFKKL